MDEDNNTYGQTINGSVYEFRLRFSDDDSTPSPCYITEFDDDTFTSILGLAGAEVYPVSENNQTNAMNGKISSIVNDLSVSSIPSLTKA